MATRRRFLKSGAAIGASLVLPRWIWAFAQTPTGLKKFIQALPGLGPGSIPVASPSKVFPGYDLYEIDIVESAHQFHPQLPNASKVWGYTPKGNATPGYLGGVMVAQNDRPVRVRYTNKLPPTHPLPVDETIPGVSGFAHNRASVHLHGGLVDWTSDGGPYAWFDPVGNYGPSVAGLVKRAPGQMELYYPNQASARLLWYHDHAIGITRQNAYAGIASAYIIRDSVEAALINNGIIPAREIPLILQDKTFVDGSDSNYVWGKPGDLWYPYRYETTSDEGNCSVAKPGGRWDYGPCADPPGAVQQPPRLPTPSSVPEFFSDTPVINGAAYPYLTVEPRRYRFRILNGSQARFYNLQLYYANSTGTEIDLKALRDGRIVPNPATVKAGPRMIQIGTETGFLPFPVVLNDPPRPINFDTGAGPTNGNANSYTLLMAPGERADVIINFSAVPPGSVLLLYNDAPAPFPGGDTRNDYYTGDADQSAVGGAATTVPGVGPNTRTLMQISVVPRVGPPDPPSMDALEREALSLNTSATNPLNSPAATGAAPAAATVAPPSAILPASPILSNRGDVPVRNLTLNEDFDEFGRLIQLLGTDTVFGKNSQGLQTFGRPYDATPTELPRAGSVEIWRIFNNTGDTHPMHFHLVNVRVLSRRAFTMTLDPWGKLVPTFVKSARRPDANELGFKETVRMNPGEMTEILIHFDLAKVPFEVPFSPRLRKGYGIEGYEYVWHCHILEHEEHDMMRPLVVIP
jgi:spore coat protein A